MPRDSVTTAQYAIEHVTRYVHAERAFTSHHVTYLQPRRLPRQAVLTHHVEVTPEAADRHGRVDYFGNDVEQFDVLTPYKILQVTGRSTVAIATRETSIDRMASPRWEQARSVVADGGGAPEDRVRELTFASPYVEVSDELAAFAAASFAPDRPLVDAAMDLMARIHDTFTFDPSATTITTPISRVLELRQGVCQDFAHLQIGCLRALGLAARYVSGYLLTNPPPGQPRLQGADASHAWLSVFCPENGWVDLDPTNNLLPDEQHITLAWGRDYGDVSPVRGVVLGGGKHVLHVGVNVVPLDPDALQTQTQSQGVTDH